MIARSRRLLARLAVLALASGTVVALTAPGASGGLPPTTGVFEVPAGATVTFVEPYMTACNQLEWGYEVDGGTDVVVDEFAGGCGSEDFGSTTIGPFASDVSIRLFLTDVTCQATYYSDGEPVDHAGVFGTGPWFVGIGDAGFECDVENSPVTIEDGSGNLQLFVSINPVLTVRKVVTGDDPGIAFPITVECEAEGRIPAEVSASADPEIVLDGPEAADGTTVALANGQSANIPVVLDSPYIVAATCTVTETLDGVTLPAGYTCSAPVVDHPEVVWEDDEWSAAPVTVTNACVKAVELQPTFTG